MAIESENTDQITLTSANEMSLDKKENELRPDNLENYIGQQSVKQNVQVFASAAANRGETLDHTLLYGPPGLGKTTLCLIMAKMMNAPTRSTSGPAMEKPGDLAAILSNLQKGEFLFIDEIHRLRRPVEEILYTAMEDFFIDIVIGKGPSARTMRLDVPPFTLVGATTQFSLLSGPLRDRFGHIERLDFYEKDEIAQILTQSAGKLQIELPPEAATSLASACRRTPRIANRLLRRMRDFAEVNFDGKITLEVVQSGLKALNIDPRGLDKVDMTYLKTLGGLFGGGPTGLSTIAAAMGDPKETLEEVTEPFLLQEGLIQRTPRGRVMTERGLAYLGEGNLFDKNLFSA